MNNERYNQIILDVYREHCLLQSKYLRNGGTVQEFINKIKTDQSFSEKWGLKIEERELSLEERAKLLSDKLGYEIKETPLHGEGHFEQEVTMDTNAFNIPTRVITVTYKDEKIEVYE